MQRYFPLAYKQSQDAHKTQAQYTHTTYTFCRLPKPAFFSFTRASNFSLAYMALAIICESS